MYLYWQMITSSCTYTHIHILRLYLYISSSTQCTFYSTLIKKQILNCQLDELVMSNVRADKRQHILEIVPGIF